MWAHMAWPCICKNWAAIRNRKHQNDIKGGQTHWPCNSLPHSRPAMPKSSRGWWRDHFYDHPLLAIKSPVASFGAGQSAKLKVDCKECFNHDFLTIQVGGQTDFDSGCRPHVRTRQQVEEDHHQLFNSLSLFCSHLHTDFSLVKGAITCFSRSYKYTSITSKDLCLSTANG